MTKSPVTLIDRCARVLLGLAFIVATGAVAGALPAAPPLPQRLSETGLFAPGSTTEMAAGVIAFAPQYPLWSDGTRKRRWIHLPPGTSIDASDPDQWQFPVGTRLWKEFAHDRRIETRFIERLADGSWRFVTYVWKDDGSDALLAPQDGAMVAASRAPQGRYAVPSRDDCRACHEGAAVPVLGFSALQLSPDRDPLAAHAEALQPGQATLRSLAAQGKLANLPPALLTTPPRIGAATPTARAALGYLHGNCGHCHNTAALDGLDMVLAQRADPGADSVERALQSLFGHSSRFRPRGADRAQRIARDGSGNHVLTLRMRTDNPLARMPPLGVQVIDEEGVALIERWIAHELKQHQEKQP